MKYDTTEHIDELRIEIEEILSTMNHQEQKHWWDKNGSSLPVSEEYASIVESMSYYQIWACDDVGNCLVGEGDDLSYEHIDNIIN